MRISFLGVCKALVNAQSFPIALKGDKGDKGDSGTPGAGAVYVNFTDEVAFNDYTPAANETAVLNE